MENKRYRPTALEWLWHSGAGSYKVAADHQLATGSQHCRSSSTSIQNTFCFLEAVNYVRYFICTSLFRSKSFQWATFVIKCTSQSSSSLSWWWGNWCQNMFWFWSPPKLMSLLFLGLIPNWRSIWQAVVYQTASMPLATQEDVEAAIAEVIIKQQFLKWW